MIVKIYDRWKWFNPFANKKRIGFIDFFFLSWSNKVTHIKIKGEHNFYTSHSHSTKSTIIFNYYL